MPLPLVQLYEFQGLALIVKAATGIRFTNQVGGTGCFHPEVEGVLVPLPERVGRPEYYALSQHFRGDWSALEESDADVIDRILHRNGLGWMKVDRARLGESWEAWVHVHIDPSTQDLFEASHWVEGILTWENSD
jgi:hypothetical protein